MYALKTNPQTKLSSSQFQGLQQSFVELRKLLNDNAEFGADQRRHYFAYTIFQVLEYLAPKQLDTDKAGVVTQFLNLSEIHFKEIRNVGQYANMLNISESKLSAEVKRVLGKTPLQLLHDYLQVEIKRLIVLGQHSHKEISFLLHFDSQSSYTRFVAKQFGQNPSELQRSLQIHK